MSFGSHGGADHYAITDDAEVERLLTRDVSEADRADFRAELVATAPYVDSPVLRARMHLAMLYLAGGDLEKLRQVRAVADRDWRDLLAMAEYPSTPPYGTAETAAEKRTRQQDDRDSYAGWRDQPNPADRE